MTRSLSAISFVAPLVQWFSENQRPLPWRDAYDPYHVWVSEVMLQQTQVETALPYYERFLSEFPTIEALAGADEQRVLSLWAGLGYYSRARNLLAAAQKVTSEWGGAIPSDYAQLRTLPGIGQYMAGAILSIAFNRPFPVVDGNVRRVLSRIYGWTDDNPKDLWNAAARIVEQAEPRQVNQALMELGAKVCSFRAPRCLLCPIQKWCVAFKTSMQNEIPRVRKRPQTIHIHLVAILCERGSRYLMKSSRGLWEFPTFSTLPAGAFSRVGECKHVITHHRLSISIYSGELPDAAGLEWQEPDSVPLSSMTRKILTASVRKNIPASKLK